MTNQILHGGDRIIVKFKYSPTILNAVRTILGRKFSAEKKHWEVPLESVVDCVTALEGLGFHITPEVMDLYGKRNQQLEEIRELKKVDAPYTGYLPLYAFQKTGAAFMRALPAALLADEPGLGKTLQTAATFEDCADQVLVFVPASLKFNWADELKKWMPGTTVQVIHGDKQERTEQWLYAIHGNARGYPKWVIANYELLLHDSELMETEKKMWGGIVCDEADRISNPTAKTTVQLKKLRAKKRIALTGTPVSNTPEDIWSIVDWLYPRYLGNFSQFQARYCVTREEQSNGQTYQRLMRYQNLDELKERLEPVMLRRLKADVLTDFPPKTVQHIRFDLGPVERGVYESVRKLILSEIRAITDLDTRSLMILPVKMLRLKQATDHLKLIDAHQAAYSKSAKLETLREMLGPIVASGEKAIVFTQFAEMAHILKEELQKFAPLVIWGGVDALERKHIVDEFTADPERRVLIMTEAGTYGLNVQAATYVFHYDAPWSVSKIEQREGRAHRVGQDKPVTVYHLVANKTIDEHVLKVLAGKRMMSAQILGDEAGPVETFSIADLEEILEEKI